MRKGLVLVLFALLGIPAPAHAHASYKTSDPPDRSTVGAAPASIWAEFTEPLGSGSYLQVYDPCGQRVDDNDTQISGYRMSITQSSNRSGLYTVRFRALSTLDPHEVNGSFTFTATGGEPCPGSEPEPEPEQEQTARGSDATDPNQGPTAAGGTAQDAGQESSSSVTGSEDGNEKGKGKEVRIAPRRDGKNKKAVVLAARRDRRGKATDDIPLGTLAVALVISALIGAAGGKVYAGIMGPRA
jgi:methionine-rich copper-binding protein CopC